MSTLTEIEKAVSNLPQEDFRLLLHRMQERDAVEWDLQIEEHARNGKLDTLYARLTGNDQDHTKLTLNEVLDDPEFS